ncbi:MAG: hypothetical protein J6K72_02500 [Clostridia bacterium]|nr:hypothetical protein [Clostridia bacterium]
MEHKKISFILNFTQNKETMRSNMARGKAFRPIYPQMAAFKKGALSPLKAKIEPLVSCTFRIFHIRTAPFLHSANRPNYHSTSPAASASRAKMFFC